MRNTFNIGYGVYRRFNKKNEEEKKNKVIKKWKIENDNQ